MPRDLAAGMQASLASADGYDVVWFVHAGFSGGDIRATTASADLEWAGETWEALGGAIRIGAVTEDPDQETQGQSITLSGVDQILVQKLLTEHVIGRPLVIWRAHMDTTTGQIVDAPMLSFEGEMLEDFQLVTDVTENVSTIQTRAVSRVGRSAVRPILRMNPESHGHIHSGDLFYDHVASLATKQGRWAGKTTRPLRDRPPPDFPGDERGQYPNG